MRDQRQPDSSFNHILVADDLKRIVRWHYESQSAVAIQRIQRGVFARQMISSKREFVNFQRAAGRIQRLVVSWQASCHGADIDALKTVRDTCARCATCRASVFVFDLQQLLCTNCVTAMTKAMSHQRESLRTCGRFLGTMIPLDLKRRLDPRVASVQRWWRLRAFRTVVSTCCAVTGLSPLTIVRKNACVGFARYTCAASTIYTEMVAEFKLSHSLRLM